MTLRARLLTLFLLLAIVPLLALGAVEYVRSLSALEAMIGSQNARVADRVAATVRSRVALMQSDLLLLAENAETQRWLSQRVANVDDSGVGREADRFIRAAWDRMSSSYGGMVYADSQQRVIYQLSGSVGAEVTSLVAPRGLMAPVSQTIHQLGTGDVLGSVSLVPILPAIFPLDVLAGGFGERGHGMVLDRATGQILYHPDHDMSGVDFRRLIASGEWAVEPATLAQEAGRFRYRARGERRIASFVSMPSPPWTVVVSASVDEFAGPFTTARRLSLVTVLLAALVVTLVFSELLRRTTRSLEELTAATDVVARGDFTPTLPPAGRDEVGRLSAAFATMVARVREMVSQIESSRQMAVLGQFAAQLSHEIRNPLTSIKLNLQKLDREVRERRLPDTAARPLEISLREVARLDGVVRGVLDLARARPKDIASVSLHRLADEAAEVVSSQLDQQGIVLERAYEANHDSVLVDHAQIKGALLNLMLNAVDAMPTGGTLKLRTVRAEGWIRLLVTDSGRGIDGEARDSVFRPFYTTKATGTGLGLPLARRAIEDNSGTLTLAPAREHGTEFVIALPLTAET